MSKRVPRRVYGEKPRPASFRDCFNLKHNTFAYAKRAKVERDLRPTDGEGFRHRFWKRQRCETIRRRRCASSSIQAAQPWRASSGLPAVMGTGVDVSHMFVDSLGEKLLEPTVALYSLHGIVNSSGSVQFNFIFNIKIQ